MANEQFVLFLSVFLKGCMENTINSLMKFSDRHLILLKITKNLLVTMIAFFEIPKLRLLQYLVTMSIFKGWAIYGVCHATLFKVSNYSWS